MANPEKQLPLFDNLPQDRTDLTDFLKPDGKKKNKIPTGMTRKEINKLKTNKAKRGTPNADWPNEY